MENRFKIAASLAATALGVTGCVKVHIASSDGNGIPMSELTREVTWEEDADLLMFQSYAKVQAITNACNDLDEIEQVGQNALQTEYQAQRDEWIFPRMSEAAKNEWETAFQAMVRHYSASGDICKEHSKELKKVGYSVRSKRDN
ncbi:hypothetical protein OTK49_00490 [Vibrio coralliirubri]|uniref:hypothetical protein n=1 Tax=Vibrio coralliirubri TaxID=1516159 RepID=UPI0022846B25|nr:hypothetical protein [Vibrio coralliirubri]MCY9861019.1 hypothetical protein [Vibrio coralliirubri]